MQEKVTDIKNKSESESEKETRERYPYQSCNEGNPEIAFFIRRLLIKSKILGEGLKKKNTGKKHFGAFKRRGLNNNFNHI